MTEDTDSKPDRVLVSKKHYHRPARGTDPEDRKTACRKELEVHRYRIWPIERAEEWREPCGERECFGNPKRRHRSEDSWPVSTDGGRDLGAELDGNGLTVRVACAVCGSRNTRTARYCNWCGSKLRELEAFESPAEGSE